MSRGPKGSKKNARNDGWVFIDSTFGRFAERDGERHRICSTRVPHERASEMFKSFVAEMASKRDMDV